jgi:EmrB/QacA subfamily drug resistance transporter
VSTSSAAGDAVATEAPHRSGGTAALLVIVLSQFMVGIDATVVNIALPKIHAGLHFSETGLAWVTSGYAVAFGGLLLLGARAGDVLGRRRLFITGLLLFGVASLLAGLSPSAGWLIAWRVVQGASAALAAPNSLALVATNFEEGAERNKAFGAVAGSYAASLALGLILGGLLTWGASWRWVMFINVPLAVLVLVLAPIYIREADRHPGRFDFGGGLLSAGTLVALVYALLHAASSGWDNTVTLTSLGLSGLFLLGFLAVESRAKQPVLPLQLFASRNRTGGYVTLVGLTATMSAMNYFVTQLMQNGLGLSPVVAGVSFLPLAAGILSAGNFAGKALAKTGPKPLILGGSVLIFGAALWLSQFSDSANYATGLLGPLILFGVGAGLAFTAIAGTILSDISGEHAGSASSVLEVMQWLGFALGVSVLTTVFGGATRTASGSAKHVLVTGVDAAFLASLIFVAISFVACLVVIGKPVAPAMSAEQESVAAEVAGEA